MKVRLRCSNTPFLTKAKRISLKINQTAQSRALLETLTVPQPVKNFLDLYGT
jgi:hypothetical protein